MAAKPLTGRKVFIFTASAFALIIGVNLYMARQAVSTFPGLVTEDSYNRSQEFNVSRAAQEALGWTVEATIEDGELRLTMADANGLFVDPAELEVSVGRPTHMRDDFVPEFALKGAVLSMPVDLAPGNWTVTINAVAQDGTEFRRRIDLYVRS